MDIINLLSTDYDSNFDIDLLKKSIINCSNINFQDNNGNTPLIMLCADKHIILNIEIMELMFKCGANVGINFRNNMGQTPFIVLSRYVYNRMSPFAHNLGHRNNVTFQNYMNLVNLMIDYGANININYYSITIKYVMNFCRECINLELLQNIINNIDDDNLDKLILANLFRIFESKNLSLEMVKLIIKKYENKNIKNICEQLYTIALYKNDFIKIEDKKEIIRYLKNYNIIDVNEEINKINNLIIANKEDILKELISTDSNNKSASKIV